MPSANPDKSAQLLALYPGLGPDLMHYRADAQACTLSSLGSLRLPQNVHYAWPSASGEFLYRDQ